MMNPITRKELFLAKAAGENVETPEPITREEIFLDRAGHPSWNAVKDKPFGEVETKTHTLEIDAERIMADPDLIVVANIFVRISDATPTAEELAGATLGDGEGTIDVQVEPGDGGVLLKFSEAYESVIGAVIQTDDAVFGNALFPKKGIYVFSAVLEEGEHFLLTTPNYEFTKTGTHKIDPKYIPGVTLPLVELTTQVTSDGVEVTESENAMLNEVWELGTPIMLNGALEVLGLKDVTVLLNRMTLEREAGTVYREFITMIGATIFELFSADNGTWRGRMSV